jgi:hypothetical protein
MSTVNKNDGQVAWIMFLAVLLSGAALIFLLGQVLSLIF